MTTPQLAVIGAGQLARMMVPPAVGLGVELRLLAEAPDASAAQVIVEQEVGSHLELADLERGIGAAPIVTFDHEHVPTEHLRALAAKGVACRPGPDALLHAQDKLVMRRKLREIGVPCPRWAGVSTLDEIREFGFPLVLKTPRGGYDGKGVWVLRDEAAAAEVLAAHPGPLLAEELVDFKRELSAQVARSAGGQTAVYPVVESRQRDGVCAEVIAPAPNLDQGLSNRTQQMAVRIAEELDVVGMLAVELFATDDERVLVNELAMRPHNTGHWSIDGARTSQFENHLRAVLDLPLGDTTPTNRWAVMVNILGGTVTDLIGRRKDALAAEPDVKIHLYGKEVRPGRKVGHVTAVGAHLEEVIERARRSANILTDASLTMNGADK